MSSRWIGLSRNRWADLSVNWRRSGFLIRFLILCLPWPATAASLDLWWDASPDPDTAGYVVYYGPVGSPSLDHADVGNATFATLDNFQDGQAYFFYLTAYDSARIEAEPSPVANYTVPSSNRPNTTPALGTILDQTVTVTSNLTFTATATDTDGPAQILTFSLDDGAPSGASIDPASGVFSWEPTTAQPGIYQVTVRVTDNGWPALSAFQAISITVNPANASPDIVEPLADRAALQGETVTLGVVATGSPAPDYRWLVNGNPLAGAAGSTLVLTNLQPTNAGTYMVIVTNLYGATNSTAQLLVEPPPDPTQAPTIALLPDRPGVFTLSFTNLPGYSYLVLTNADLGTTNWGTLLSVPAAFNSGVLKLSQSASNAAHLFYRVIVLSN